MEPTVQIPTENHLPIAIGGNHGVLNNDGNGIVQTDMSGLIVDQIAIDFLRSGVGIVSHYSGGEATAVAVDATGNVFVTGSSATIAYSGAGVPLWTNRYNGLGDGYDVASALAVDGSGNVFVTGYSTGSYYDYAYDDDYATIAYSGAGVPLWTNRYNASGRDRATALTVDDSGNVFVTGSPSTIAYSGAGVPLWTNRYGGASVAVDGSGHVFVTGSSTMAYSGAGVPLWANRYGGATVSVEFQFLRREKSIPATM